AARTLAAGMMSGLTSPTKPWFKLGLHDLQKVDYGPAKQWLAECERRILRVLSESNFYQSLGTLYHDNAVFGSAALLIYEDARDVIRCYNPCLGEFFFDADSRLSIGTFAREFTLNLQQLVQQFGVDNISESSAQGYRSGGATRTYEVVVQHMIEPNTPIYDGEVQLGYLVPKKFPFREVYWEINQRGDQLLQASGYNEQPFIAARWDTVSNDAYGRSPGMDAMPATKQLQIEQRRKGQGIDKIVNPPMVASVTMKNEPASTLPGAITYVSSLEKDGFKPAYIVNPNLADMKEDIIEVQNRVKSVFFVDLFMMISELDTVRTATEIDARREEKLIQLGPVIERFENEVLDPIIDRVFTMMARRGLLPSAPAEIQGSPLNIQYVSMLAEAQRAASTAAIERLLALVGNMAGVFPDSIDNIDEDEAVKYYADALSVEPAIIRSTAQVIDIRTKKAKDQQMQAAAGAAATGAQTAQVLSQTDVGGGQNALQLMMGGGGIGMPGQQQTFGPQGKAA
ncbi:MAG: portal protein, partial [Gammaproteobacteria bacterium]